MSDTTYAYPFDPTGTKAANSIQGERQTISPPGWSDFYFVIPKAAPYFRESLKVYHHPSGRLLVEGVDYLPTHRFHDASLAVGKPVFGSITFFDKTLEGVVELHYQTIGGKWTIDEQTILAVLSDKLTNPRITTWEEVIELPDRFPVIDHEWDLVDMVGMSAVVDKLGEIREAIILSGEGGLGDHLADFNNPHQTTKGQVGLGNVDNFPTATVPQAVSGVDNSSFMTPVRVAQAITAQALNPLNQHTSDFSNPHEVTKDQIGLGLVQNYAIGTTTEAREGNALDKYMTPSLVKSAIAFQALAPLNEHVNSRENPHGVTKAQVQLGSVDNFATATVQAAREGIATNMFMTPALVREAITSIAANDINAHVNNTNNPHSVTKAQVSLGLVQNLGLASQPKAEAGTDNDAYMTPLSVKQAITAQVGTRLTNHINDTGNPHLVTKAQVGLGNVANFPTATLAQAEEGLSESAFMTPAAVRRAIQTLGGGDVESHAARTDNPHNVTAAQVGAPTIAQVDEALAGKLDKTEVAADSALLEGMTAAQVAALSSSVVTYPKIRSVGGVNVGATWTKLGSLTAAQLSGTSTFTALLSGGETYTDLATSTVLLDINGLRPETSTVTLVSGPMPDWSIGYVQSGTGFEVWVASPVQRNAIAVFELRGDTELYTANATALDAAPANLVVMPTSRQNTGADAVAADVLYASVCATAAEVTTAMNVAADMIDDHHGFEKLYSAQPSDATKQALMYGTVADTVYWDTYQWGGRKRSISPLNEALVNYQFETTITGVGSRGAIGVVAAYVTDIDGKGHGIYLLRSDGDLVVRAKAGNVPGGSFYELMSVGYNLLDNDAEDLGSTSAGLKWGDAIVNENRTGTYDPSTVTNAWNKMGDSFKVRVTKAGAMITIEVSEVGSTAYSSGKTFSLDLSLDPMFNALFAGACRWGLITDGLSVESGSRSTFQMLNRPGKFRRYLAQQNGVVTAGTYTGQNWSVVATPATLSLTRSKLIYSQDKSRLYVGRADGTLKQLAIASSS